MRKIIPISSIIFLAIILVFTACEKNPTGTNNTDNNQENSSSNSAPTAEAAADSKTVTVGDEVILDGSGSSDPDADNLTYKWELSVPGSSSTQLSDSKVEKPTFIPDVAGDYVATLTVDDGNGETDQVDVTVTAESDVLEVGSDITSDETWTSGTQYLVTAAIEVRSGATLTIEAGVTVEFKANTGIRVSSNDAALVADGTAEAPITLTGVQKSRGFWKGIAFESSHPSNKLNNVVVEYGGSDDTWTYISEPANIALGNGARLILTNSTIRESANLGFYAELSTDLPNFGGNTVTNNSIAGGIPTTLMGGLDTGSTYTGNDNDYVVVAEQNVTDDMTISPINVPYRVKQTPLVQSDAQVIIEAGTTIEFAANAGIRVESSDASLYSAGAADAPVTLTGVQKSRGFWRGIAFDSSHPSNRLDYTVVDYGGSDDTWTYISEPANVAMSNGAKLILTNSTIRESANLGFYAELSTDLPNFSGNNITGNKIAGGIPTTLMGALDTGSTYTGNDKDYIEVAEQNVSDDMTVSPINVPYRVQQTPELWNDATVIIDAGTTIEFTANAGLRVESDNASLVALGTADKPITFTGVEKSPGFWKGIVFDSSHPDNRLEYAVVEYGGSKDWMYIQSAANISMNSGAQLILNNSTIRNSNGYGGWSDDGTNTDISFSGNTYSNNAEGSNNYNDPGS